MIFIADYWWLWIVCIIVSAIGVVWASYPPSSENKRVVLRFMWTMFAIAMSLIMAAGAIQESLQP